MARDKCLLTGQRGDFVDSHIIPKALQHSSVLGFPMLELGNGNRPEKRWTSWYDKEIVIARGERILAKYDDEAVRILRRRRLVWSGWGPMTQLSVADHNRIPNSPHGIRKIKSIEVAPLRIFFLSLLWRAAVSKMRAFEEITIIKSELEILTRMVRDGAHEPFFHFPVALVQMSTMGTRYNQSPFKMDKHIASLDGASGVSIPIFRFYFDGLIVHFGTKLNDIDHFERMGPSGLGFDKDIVVPTVTFDASFQEQNVDNVLFGAMTSHPEKVDQYFATMEKRREAAGLEQD